VRRVLHIIKEEDISSTAVGIEGLSVTAESDDEYDSGNDDHPTLSAAVLAAHARNALRAPSLQTLLEDIPVSTALSRSASSAGDSDGKCNFFSHKFSFTIHVEPEQVIHDFLKLFLSHVVFKKKK
jgi:translation initiation factor eIF-2B subunit beta